MPEGLPHPDPPHLQRVELREAEGRPPGVAGEAQEVDVVSTPGTSTGDWKGEEEPCVATRLGVQLQEVTALDSPRCHP